MRGKESPTFYPVKTEKNPAVTLRFFEMTGKLYPPKITLTTLYILIEVDGKTVVELDKLNEVYKVNGVDVLAKIKEMC